MSTAKNIHPSLAEIGANDIKNMLIVTEEDLLAEKQRIQKDKVHHFIVERCKSPSTTTEEIAQMFLELTKAGIVFNFKDDVLAYLLPASRTEHVPENGPTRKRISKDDSWTFVVSLLKKGPHTKKQIAEEAFALHEWSQNTTNGAVDDLLDMGYLQKKEGKREEGKQGAAPGLYSMTEKGMKTSMEAILNAKAPKGKPGRKPKK